MVDQVDRVVRATPTCPPLPHVLDPLTPCPLVLTGPPDSSLSLSSNSSLSLPSPSEAVWSLKPLSLWPGSDTPSLSRFSNVTFPTTSQPLSPNAWSPDMVVLLVRSSLMASSAPFSLPLSPDEGLS